MKMGNRGRKRRERMGERRGEGMRGKEKVERE